MIDGEPWFVGKDVARALGYAKTENAVAAHVDSEDKKTITLNQGSDSSRKSKTTIINESGLYSLILGSKLESAKRFKHWVTSEVLPAIRKTGSYSTEEKVEDKYAEYRNPWGETSDAVIRYNMDQLNRDIDEISELYGLEKNRTLSYLYGHISEYYGIPLNSYKAVLQSETGEELSTMKVVCMSPIIFAMAMESTKEVIERKRVFG